MQHDALYPIDEDMCEDEEVDDGECGEEDEDGEDDDENEENNTNIVHNTVHIHRGNTGYGNANSANSTQNAANNLLLGPPPRINESMNGQKGPEERLRKERKRLEKRMKRLEAEVKSMDRAKSAKNNVPALAQPIHNTKGGIYSPWKKTSGEQESENMRREWEIETMARRIFDQRHQIARGIEDQLAKNQTFYQQLEDARNLNYIKETFQQDRAKPPSSNNYAPSPAHHRLAMYDSDFAWSSKYKFVPPSNDASAIYYVNDFAKW